jgi:hypothetical protein
MIRILLIAGVLLCALTTAAESRQRSPAVHPDCNITMPCDLRYAPAPTRREQARRDRGKRIERAMPFGRATQRRTVPVAVRTPPTIAGYIQRTVQAVGVSIVGVVAPLQAKVMEIQNACGSKVISAVRRTYIAGTRVVSLHASGQAVDLQGNPDCIYAHLNGWAGGYSTDYARMKHVHISWSDGGREWGARFVHRGRPARRAVYASAN